MLIVMLQVGIMPVLVLTNWKPESTPGEPSELVKLEHGVAKED